MQIKCEHCGTMVDGSMTYCTECGARIPDAPQEQDGQRSANGQPRTIEELKQWYIAHNLPPEETTRFFIGRNIQERRAFGIYREDDGDIVVYKNKNNGQRAVRYKGPDEAFAVSELLSRLKEEINNQKAGQSSRSSGGNRSSHRKKASSSDYLLVAICAGFAIMCLLVGIFDKSPKTGYYRYGNRDYYYQGSDWYYYDDSYNTWYAAYGDLIPEINCDNDEQYEIYSFDHEGQSFEDSGYYYTGDSYSSDDYSWDSNDSWDSGSMDFDSDW